MRKSIVLIVSILCFASCSFGMIPKTVHCKGPVEERAVLEEDFTSVEVNGAFKIEYSQGASAPVTVKTNSDAFEYLDIHMEKGGKLVIENVRGVNLRTDVCLVTISSQLLERVSVNGAANLTMKGGYVSDKDFRIDIAGAGKINLSGLEVPCLGIQVNGAAGIDAENLAVGEVSVVINGAASALISGTAGKASLTVNGAGKINAAGLVCSDIKVEKNGLAKITLPSE